MTSSINPNLIDGNYPIAGTDNSSQGFRDNFTGTAQNFQAAASEISDLQSKAILKAPLSGTALSNNMLGSALTNAVIADFALTVTALGTLSGIIAINYAVGHVQSVTTSGPITIAFSGWPTAGTTGIIQLLCTVSDVTHTITFPTAVSSNTNGLVGLDPTTNIFTAPAIGTYIFTLTTTNNGTSITINNSDYILQPLNASFENFVSGSAVNLSVDTTCLTTNGSDTGTLADGVEGLVKTIVNYTQTSGTTVITVASPGWGGAGTITFSTAGQSCILKFIQGMWYCISNNGSVFA